MRGGYRPGAGRPPKSKKKSGKSLPNNDTKGNDEIPKTIGNKTPLDYMLAVMNDSSVNDERRDRMAIAAAPFVHQKKIEGGKKEKKGEAAKKVAESGRFKAPSAPRLVVNNT